MTRVAGLVLAGGRSSRFGGEKAVAELGDRPLIAWSHATLRARAESVAISAPVGSGAAAYADAAGLTCQADGATALAGPLNGIVEGLRWAIAAGGRWLATAPCDTPFLPADLVNTLMERRSVGGAVARTSRGLQPLCALWPAFALGRLEGLQSHPAIREVLAGLGAAEVEFTDVGAFDNLNTPEALEAAKAHLNGVRSRAKAPAR